MRLGPIFLCTNSLNLEILYAIYATGRVQRKLIKTVHVFLAMLSNKG